MAMTKEIKKNCDLSDWSFCGRPAQKSTTLPIKTFESV